MPGCGVFKTESNGIQYFCSSLYEGGCTETSNIPHGADVAKRNRSLPHETLNVSDIYIKYITNMDIERVA